MQVLKNSSSIIDSEHIYRYIVVNPSVPILNELPKIHKLDIPMRPVVSYVTAPAYKLCLRQ